jgi:dimeric dUTPase (all-alpha-NTP-PPase superfamily)
MLIDMFTLQQKLNDATNGEGWECGYNKHNRIINWRRCIHMECAELIDSFNWKHWKDINIEPDWDNVVIELVDIWHFVMSQGLERYKSRNLGNINDIVEYVMDTKYFDDFCHESMRPDSSDYNIIVNSIELFMLDALAKEDFYRLTDDFFKVSMLCGLSIKQLYKLYLAKNVLNGFRQDNGYKEGTYKKIWNGKEDNDVMMSILSQKSLDADELYKALDDIYKKLNS